MTEFRSLPPSVFQPSQFLGQPPPIETVGQLALGNALVSLAASAMYGRSDYTEALRRHALAIVQQRPESLLEIGSALAARLDVQDPLATVFAELAVNAIALLPMLVDAFVQGQSVASDILAALGKSHRQAVLQTLHSLLVARPQLTLVGAVLITKMAGVYWNLDPPDEDEISDCPDHFTEEDLVEQNMCAKWFSAQHQDITKAMRKWLRSSSDGPRAAAILSLGILSPPGFDAEDHFPTVADSAGPVVEAALFVLSGFDNPAAESTPEYFAEPFLRNPTPEMLRALVDIVNQYGLADDLFRSLKLLLNGLPEGRRFAAEALGNARGKRSRAIVALLEARQKYAGDAALLQAVEHALHRLKPELFPSPEEPQPTAEKA